MGDWSAIGERSVIPKDMSFDCFYNDFNFWHQNENCEPWKGTSTSIKAYKSDVKDAYAAFQIFYTVEFVTTGTIEFKYRKDAKEGKENAEFKFAMDEKIVYVDGDPAKNGW